MDAQNLKLSIKGVATQKGVDNNNWLKTSTAFNHLAKSLAKAKQTKFLSVISQSTLDFEPTREHFGKISNKLLPCFNMFITLCHEYDCGILLSECEGKTVNEKGNIELPNELFFYCTVDNKPYYDFFFKTKAIGSELANRAIQFADKLSKFKDLSSLKAKLTGLYEKITSGDQRPDDAKSFKCDACGNAFKPGKEIFNFGETCGHNLCMNCLIEMNGKRFNKYKCPVKGCGKTLNKSKVDYYIAHAEKEKQ